MPEQVLAKDVVNEALNLCETIIDELELNKSPLSSVVLRAARLSRILGDFSTFDTLNLEMKGYPVEDGIVPPEVWNKGLTAGRVWSQKDKDGNKKKYMYTESIGELESVESAMTERIRATQGTSISSEYASVAMGNIENNRTLAVNQIKQSRSRLESRKVFIYNYVISKYYDLKLENVAENIFSRYTMATNAKLADYAPNSARKFVSVYENLNSDHEEDWSNAVHSCRRILQELADSLFPPTEDKILESGKSIKLGANNYINRIIMFIQSKSSSKKFHGIVGSNLKFIGERLDAVYDAANKGTHETITDKNEAERYVIYTYLLINDILSLIDV